MIRDRGRIKWTSMMLPEHVKLLRDWAKEDTYEKPKELDEQQVEEFNNILSEAMEYRKELAITYYAEPRHQFIIGKIHYIDAVKHIIHVVDQFDAIHYISLQGVADIQFT